MDCLSVRLHFNYTDGRYLAAHEILQRYCDVSKFPKSKKILATPSRLGVARPCLRAVLGSKFAHLNITIADVSFFKNEWVVQEIQKQGWICVDWSIPTLLFITYLMYGMREQPYITYMMYRKRAARIFDPRRQPEKSQKSCKRNTANVLNGCDIGAILMVYTCKEDSDMSFSTSIKKVRLDVLMSQKEFAEALGVSFSTVNRWENGKGLPTFKAMKAISTLSS